MNILEQGKTLVNLNSEITRQIEKQIYDSSLYDAIEMARNYYYKDLTFKGEEIKNQNTGETTGIAVKLEWNKHNSKQRETKITVYPDGIIEFGWNTKQEQGLVYLERKTWENVDGKVYQSLLDLMHHSPTQKIKK